MPDEKLNKSNDEEDDENSNLEKKPIKEEKKGDTEESTPNQDDESVSNECETLDLTQAISKLSMLTKEETLLLINTTSWEDNIIFDFNQNQTVNYDAICNKGTVLNQSAELINERIKYAAWVPSSEHRTLLSYQSKILGKKSDYLESYKDQAVPTVQHQSSKHHASNNSSNAVNALNWSSIFPNENYSFIYGDWEKKIILDPKVNLFNY